MNESRVPEFLAQIRQAASDARTFVEGMSKEDFLADKRTQQAVVMSLVIVGEVATKVMDRYPNFATRYAAVPWRNIRGMRNRIAHGYFDLNLDVVWETVQTALPELLLQLSQIDVDV
jgi:uncharacterized protein with HEPN domain